MALEDTDRQEFPRLTEITNLMQIARLSSQKLTGEKKLNVKFPPVKTSSHLFTELLFTQLIQRVEFFRQDEVLLKAATCQFHTNDNCTIWYHHCHRPEVDLQILWQLLATSVSWVLHTISLSSYRSVSGWLMDSYFPVAKSVSLQVK
jgi:hypothetical protein